MPPKDNEGKAKPKIPSKGKEEKTSPQTSGWSNGMGLREKIEKVETIGKNHGKNMETQPNSLWKNPLILNVPFNQPILGRRRTG